MQVQRNMQVYTLSSTSHAVVRGLFIDFMRHGSDEQIHSDLDSPFVFMGESVINKTSILPCSRPRQTYSMYSGSASSAFCSGCQSYSFSQSAVSLCGSSQQTKCIDTRIRKSFGGHISHGAISSSIAWSVALCVAWLIS